MRDVMFAFPHCGEVKTEFMMSLFAAVNDGESRIGELREFRTGPAMAQARNQITRMFLLSGMDWLWMVDTDMMFSGKTLPALLSVADPDTMPVVGALCFVQAGPETGEQYPTMFEGVRDEAGKFTFKSYDRFPMNDPVQVAATGAGCILIHRDVFGKIAKVQPEYDGLWWAETLADGCLFGEDFSFCMRCALAKVPVHVHTGVQVGHLKSSVLGTVTP